MYWEMIGDCNKVLGTNPDMEVMGVLWHQGESDSGNPWAYNNDLDYLVNSLRNDLVDGRGKNVPFVCGTLMKSWRDVAKTSYC